MQVMNIDEAITNIPNIGEVFEKRANSVGIQTIRDFLYYFPQRYEDFSKITSIKNIKLNEKNCVCGIILETGSQRSFKRKLSITESVIQDKTGAIKAVWFGQPYLKNTLKKGDTVCLAGKVILSRNEVVLQSPVYEKVYSSDFTHTGRIIPIYPETKGLSSRWIRYVLKPVLESVDIEESLPKEIVKEEKFLPLKKAIKEIHFPSSFDNMEKARKRFAFEELFTVELSVLRQKFRLKKEKSPSVPFNVEIIKRLVKSLPFKLTDAQRKCTYQIVKDLEKTCPMSRLLEGDVGSGKTVVAVLAVLSAVKAGYQAAFMAPTEILVKQHFNEVSKLLQPFKVRIALLTGKQDKIISQKLSYGGKPEILEISRTKILERIKQGEIDVLVGTHTLIQDKVKFGNLALAIIDEQHRFGVKQRSKLLTDNKWFPHLLSMTATPIPRTLALTIYGDLDLSLLDELPKGRKKIETKVISPKDRNKVYDFVKEEIKKGKQIFVICPKIEETEKSELKAVKEESERLKKEVFLKEKIEILHGKMKTKEKEKIMTDFKNKKFDILVSTSVVEVGVDVPNATCMIIEGSERFGLAQLHQFRGRVGRGRDQAYCFLFTDSRSQKTRQRLSAILKAKNGFELAEKDLSIRGPGSLYGIKQWGLPDVAMENLTNLKLVEKTRESAKTLLYKDPNLNNCPFLKQKVEAFEKRIHLE